MLVLSSVGESVFELVVVLVIFIGVLLLTYFTTRWVAGYQKGRMVNQNLEIIETLKITTNKYVQIIRAGKGRYFLIGIGKNEVSSLGELSREEIRILKDPGAGKDVFQSLLGRFQKKSDDR